MNLSHLKSCNVLARIAVWQRLLLKQLLTSRFGLISLSAQTPLFIEGLTDRLQNKKVYNNNL